MNNTSLRSSREIICDIQVTAIGLCSLCSFMVFVLLPDVYLHPL